MKRCLALACVSVALALTGCGDGESATPAVQATAVAYPLGWLGATASPTDRHVSVPDPDRPSRLIAAGGLVLTAVESGAPLAEAGAQTNDVIVQVDGDWVPNKEDPTLDVMRSVEMAVSGGRTLIPIGVWRGNRLETISVAHDLAPLEVGLPAASERLTDMTQRALARLDTLLEVDAAPSSSSVLARATAGLAFLGGGHAIDSPTYGPRVAACREFVVAAVTDDSLNLDVWSAAWATIFLAETLPPIDAAPTMFVQSGGPARMTRMPGGPGGPLIIGPDGTPLQEVPEGAVVMETWSNGPGETMARYPDGGDAPTFVTGSGGEPPEGMPDIDDLMASGNVQIMMAPGGAPPPGMMSEPAPATEAVDGPLWTLEEITMVAGPERATDLEPLIAAVDRLVALRDERGAWDDASNDLGYSSRTLATNQALLALGVAQRAGAPVDETVIRDALGFVRESTNDGHVFAVEETGFDRRREAGRSSGAAAALLALNCLDNDEFLTDLVGYSDQYADSMPHGGPGVALHVLNTAVLRRQRGRDTWAVFFEEFKPLLVAVQSPDGSFAAWPGDGTTPFDAHEDDPLAHTAAWTITCSLQTDTLPLLRASTTHPLHKPMKSDGTRVGGGPAPAPPTGMPDMETIRRMLEAQGIDPDQIEGNIEFTIER